MDGQIVAEITPRKAKTESMFLETPLKQSPVKKNQLNSAKTPAGIKRIKNHCYRQRQTYDG